MALRRSLERLLSRQSTALVALGVITLANAACSVPRVDSESRPGVDLSGLSTASIELVFPAGMSDFTSALVDEIERSAAQMLESKGYHVVPRTDARMLVVVTPRIETVLRQSFDSDPDVARVRTVTREAATIVVTLIDREAGHDVWRSTAQSAIPRLKVPWAQSREELWVETVVAALAEIDPIEGEQSALR